MQNKYETLFDSFLDLTEFRLVKHQGESEEYDGMWSLVDLQGANLGDIESNRFNNAAEIFDRMDVYINDYFLNDLENELDAYDVDLGDKEVPWSCEQWLALKADDQFYNDNRKYFDDHQFEFDVLDMICNHAMEIDLEKCTYSEEE